MYMQCSVDAVSGGGCKAATIISARSHRPMARLMDMAVCRVCQQLVGPRVCIRVCMYIPSTNLGFVCKMHVCNLISVYASLTISV